MSALAMPRDSQPEVQEGALQAWIDLLPALGSLRSDEPMARHTTLAVGGPARWLFRPRDLDALIEAWQEKPSDACVIPLGRGSNMLVPDAGLDALVVDLSELNTLAIDGGMVVAGAGVRMSRFARQCAEHGLSGCEFMATVPGDIGGGVAMNAGCFAQQVSDTLQFVELLLVDGELVKVEAEALAMGYRHTQLPAGALVVRAGFALSADHPDQIRERMRAMRSRRTATQPLAQPNCGSVFKNPQGDHAARLIEAAGLKGFAIGGAQVSEQHANFIVNTGEASSRDVFDLIVRMRAEVLQRFGVALEPEVRLVGEWQFDFSDEGESDDAR